MRTWILVAIDPRLVADWPSFHATYAPMLAKLFRGRKTVLYRAHTLDWDTPRIATRCLGKQVDLLPAVELLTNAPEIAHVSVAQADQRHREGREATKAARKAARRLARARRESGDFDRIATERDVLDEYAAWIDHWQNEIAEDDLTPAQGWSRYGYITYVPTDDGDYRPTSEPVMGIRI